MKQYLAALLVLPSVMATIGGRCPPTGPTLPPPKVPADFNPSRLSSKLDSILNASSLPWNISTTSFSVELTSQDDTFFAYHHTAPVKSDVGVKKVDTNTVYRVASITKVFNILTLLLRAPALLDTPVGQHVPELQGAELYEDVTLRMLASQMAGIPRDGNAFDLYTENGDGLEAAGFPLPTPDEVPRCDTVVDRSCTRSEFFQHLLSDKLTGLPAARVAYSDQAYTITGFALEGITGKAFPELVMESVIKPLGLSSTGIEAPDLSRAIISDGDSGSFMGFDIGNFNATGGLYSTPSDLSSFLRSIFLNTLLSPARTRQWLKPSAFANSFSTAVGMPWEIFRLSNLTTDGRPIDMYTKSGDLPGYSAYIVLLPDYKVGATIMVSGEKAYAASVSLLDIVTTTLVPALDKLARDQAKKLYAGRYVKRGDGTANSSNASLSLVIDDGPGIKVEEWTNNGKSILDTVASNHGTTASKLDARLYPIGSENRWRLASETVDSVDGYPSMPSRACKAWFQVDQLRYATLPVDEFDFVMEDRAVVGVRNLGLRAELEKKQ